jgi:hypothetical protein
VTNEFQVIGEVNAQGNRAGTQFSYTDDRLAAPLHQYRIRALDKSGRPSYSNLVKLKLEEAAILPIRIYPNPVKDVVHIAFQASQPGLYQFDLMNVAGQVLMQTQKAIGGPGTVTLQRKLSMKPGVYFLKVKNTETGVETIEKLLFQ